MPERYEEGEPGRYKFLITSLGDGAEKLIRCDTATGRLDVDAPAAMNNRGEGKKK